MKRRVLIVGLGVTALAVAVLVTTRSRFDEVGGYYTCRVPDAGLAQIAIWKWPDGYRGKVWIEGRGESFWLEQASVVGRNVEFLVIDREQEWRTNAWLKIEGQLATATLDATWHATNANNLTKALSLTNIASAAGVSIERNFEFNYRGGWYWLRLAVPAVSRNLAHGWHSLFRRMLEEDYDSLRKEFGGPLQNAAEGFRGGYYGIVLCDRFYEIRLLSTNLVSLISDGYYSRGANGNSQKYHGRNFVSDGGGFAEFALPALFHADNEWIQPVLALCVEKLAQQGRHPSEGEVQREIYADRSFTVSQTGLQIYFNPYTIGSGAEGSAVVHIAYSEIAHLLDTNGPAKWLPYFQASP